MNNKYAHDDGRDGIARNAQGEYRNHGPSRV